MKTLTNIVIIIISVGIIYNTSAQIAQSYPNDIGIENNPNVVFTDMFEQSSISNMISTSGYQTSQMINHINFDASVPLGSLGTQSLKLTTVENSSVSNDPSEDANVLKKFSNGITDSIFVRYYVKYNSNFTFHHSGVWLGGTNPANQCWPCNTPGRTIPTNGDSAFVIGTEITGLAHQIPQNNSRFGFYNYWMDMKPLLSPPNAGKYFGNEFISPNSNASIDMSAWNCIEVMLKLNNPADSTGELKLWINGVLVGHYGEGFPNGTWNEATFIEGAGLPFEGFRFRSNPAVVFNYVWLKNYATNNTDTSANDVLFDHLVVAKSYIGPISTQTSSLDPNQLNKKLSIFPNPASNQLNFSEYLSEFTITNTFGQEILKSSGKFVSISNFNTGMYFLQTPEKTLKFTIIN